MHKGSIRTPLSVASTSILGILNFFDKFLFLGKCYSVAQATSKQGRFQAMTFLKQWVQKYFSTKL